MKRLSNSGPQKLGGIKPLGVKPMTKALKPLSTMTPAPDPIKGQVEYTGNIEEDAAAELTAVEAGFRERMKGEADRFKTATSSDFYCCLVFDSGGQLDAFLKATGMLPGPDLFVDGRKMAANLSIDIPPSPATSSPKVRKIDPKLTRLVQKM